MGCIICFPTSAPSVVHPTVYVGKLKLNFVHRTIGLQNILEPKRRNMRFTAEREEKANYNARSATQIPAFPGGQVSSSRSEILKIEIKAVRNFTFWVNPSYSTDGDAFVVHCSM